MDTFLERYQAFSEDLRRYVAAFQQPAPEKMQYYVDELNMYDASDPIIRLARALQQDEPPPSSVTLRDALTAAETQSVYAKALSGGFRNVEAAADYLARGLSKDERYDRVGIAEHNRY